MGLFKSIGKGLKSVGKVALKAAPIAAAFIPGVGPLAAAGIGAALGAVGHGKPKLGNILGGAATGALGAVGGGALKGATSGLKSVGSSGLMGGIKKLGGFALDNIDPIMGAASMYQGAKAQGKADDLNKRALALREQQYADFAPIRKLGIAGMQNTQRPDLSAIYRNQQNPFA
ncbi:MAG: hypothetical protein ACYC3L_01100 [Gemmatimonadaceae bacterium]